MLLSSSNCLKNIRIVFLIQFVMVFSSLAQVGRAPANVVPDDDMIVVPLNIESNIYEDFNEKHKEKFKASRQRFELWLAQEQYARDYGLEGTGAVNLPTQQEKELFIQRNYFRFLSRDFQKSSNETLKNTWSSITTNDEIDSISERDDKEEYFVKAKNKVGRKQKELETRFKVGKESFKLRFSPRLEQGMMKITFDSDYLNFNAWLGVNGNQELKFNKFFSSTNTNALLYYYIDESRVLASLDQTIKGNLTIRLAHEKDLDNFSRFFQGGKSEINSMQVRFNMGF